MSEWLAGAAEVVITPPLGVPLTGFAGRASGATGVHDDLFARALVVETNGVRAAIATADLLGLEFEQVARIREQVAAECGIPRERLLVNCSHTHSGPSINRLRAMGACDDDVVEVTLRRIAGAVAMAANRLEPASLLFGKAPARVGINRRERKPDGSIILGRNDAGTLDPTVTVLRADRQDGTPLALLFHHAAHPVTLGPSNLEITADYPGVAVEVLRDVEGRRGNRPVALFAQGCCGNINCEKAISTFEEASRLGRTLGAAASVAAEAAEPVGNQAIFGIIETLTLPLLPPPAVEEESTIVESSRARVARMEAEGAPAPQLRTERGMLEWAEDVLRAAQTGAHRAGQPFEVQVLAIGDVAFVGLSGEVFIELAQTIQRQSPIPRTVVLGYSNGCTGYVPTAAAYAEGGYEVSGAHKYYGTLMIAPESEQLITECAGRLLEGQSRRA